MHVGFLVECKEKSIDKINAQYRMWVGDPGELSPWLKLNWASIFLHCKHDMPWDKEKNDKGTAAILLHD